MLLKVNPMVGIWGYTSNIDNRYKLWFTLADPNPQEINVEELPADMAKAVQGALRTKTLFEVNAKGKKIKETSSQVLRPAVTELGINPVMEYKAKELLSGNVTSIRREVALITDSLLLAVATAVEKSQKNRKTVIDLLERQAIKTEQLKRSRTVTGGSHLEKAYAMQIEESEQETVTFNVQPINIEIEQPKKEGG